MNRVEKKRRLAAWITRSFKSLLGQAALERFLVRACRPEDRGRRFRIGALVQAHVDSFREDQFRLAEMEGYKMRVNIRETIGVQHYFWGRALVPPVVRQIVRSAAVVADIGSNMGSWTLWAAATVGPKGQVYAFEPNPKNARLIAESIQANNWSKRVQIDTRAVSDHSGQILKFYLATDPQSSGTSSLVNHGVQVDPANTIEVHSVAFDDFCVEKGLERVGFVKIDVERAELLVLHGMNRMLRERRIDFLFVELYSGAAAHQWIIAQGYSGFAIKAETGAFGPDSEVPPGTFLDLLFVRPGLEDLVCRQLASDPAGSPVS